MDFIEPTPNSRFDETQFPVLAEKGRPLYFDRLTSEERNLLESRGYAPKLLMELPRGTASQEVDYLLAKAQALEEGTCAGGKEEREIVELEMKAYKMLGDKGQVKVNINAGRQELMALLSSWGQSRHTLRGNTTIQAAQTNLKKGSRRTPAKETSSTELKKRKK